MTYVYNHALENQNEACQKAALLTATCEKFHITLDPIDWQTFGMRASVTVGAVKISDLMDLARWESDSILRRIQMKLFEHAALEVINARPGLKALIWSPIDVIQPQPFLSLWVITFENGERAAIAEYIRDDQRIYEPFQFDLHDEQQFAALFGPPQEGNFHPGDQVTIEEREQKHTGEVIYILSPGKVSTNRRSLSKIYHTTQGKAYTNDLSSRYLVDCGDGFPHIVNQSQIILTADIPEGQPNTHHNTKVKA